MVNSNLNPSKVLGPGLQKLQKPLIVSRKRKRKLQPASKKQGRKVGGSLPSFRFRTVDTSPEHPESAYDETEGPAFEIDQEVPCDTFLAIQSLQQESQGLHIPTLSGSTVQAVLESQLFQRFNDSHASTIWSEIRDMLQKNVIRKFYCQETTTSPAYLLTTDYLGGVWDAHHFHSQSVRQWDAIIEWFVSSLPKWTGSTISHSALEEQWGDDLHITTPSKEGNNDSSQCLGLDDAISYLLKLQVLLRDTSSGAGDEACYYVWLPHWGLVLKSWDEARRGLLAFVARAKGGEVSLDNVLRENRHSKVSTKFLLDEMKQQGKLRILQRPYGKFVKRVAKS